MLTIGKKYLMDKDNYMKKYFEKQLKTSQPLTKEQIEKMRQIRIDHWKKLGKDSEENITPKSMFKKPYVVGDVILYFMQNFKDSMKVSAITLSELDKIKHLKFVEMSQPSGDFPIFE